MLRETVEDRALAIQLIAEGQRLVEKQKFTLAKDKFRQSVEICPTAEGYTFWGWMLSFEGRYTEAIHLCEKAIAVDPDFGNPYNDVGCYLIELGRLQEAVPWLQRAKQAARYEPKVFPYLNLARVYMRQLKFDRAMQELRAVLRIDPFNAEAQMQLEVLADLRENIAEVYDKYFSDN